MSAVECTHAGVCRRRFYRKRKSTDMDVVRAFHPRLVRIRDLLPLTGHCWERTDPDAGTEVTSIHLETYRNTRVGDIADDLAEWMHAVVPQQPLAALLASLAPHADRCVHLVGVGRGPHVTLYARDRYR